MSPIVVKGLQSIPYKGCRPIAVTLTIHNEINITTIEKPDDSERPFIISRGRLIRMELSRYYNDETDEKNSYENIAFYLSEEYVQSILCPKGTFNRLKKEVFYL
jgi:hypothetical protein